MREGSPVRRHVHRIPKDVIFTTRELLNYAKRNTVDKTLSEFVKVGYLIRLARGVFIKQGSKIPSIYKIASAKARAFGKEIAECSFSDHRCAVDKHIQYFQQYLLVDQLNNYGLQPRYRLNRTKYQFPRIGNNKAGNLSPYIRKADSNLYGPTLDLPDNSDTEITYLTTGSTSKFKCGDTVVHFKSACARKVKLSDDTRAARCIKKMWQIGRRYLCSRDIGRIMSAYNRQDRQFMRRVLNWLPAWLSDRLINTDYLDYHIYKSNYDQFYASELKTKYMVQETATTYKTIGSSSSYVSDICNFRLIRAG